MIWIHQNSFKILNNLKVCEHHFTYVAGGSALILQTISIFSSFAAPTSIILSVAQMGASVKILNEKYNEDYFFYLWIIVKCESSSW